APDPAAALRTIRALRDEAFDVLHLHEPLAPGPTLTALVVTPAPMVGTFHAAGMSASYRLFGPVLARFAARLDHRVAVSRDALALARTDLGGEYEVLFNGVETTEIRAVEPHPVDRPAILFIGRHEERKGLGILLAALQRLSADVEVWVAGDGPDTAELRRRYERDDRIVWLGRVTEHDKLARLRGATVFCAPSLHGESFGIVLAEAMAAGTAVVASSLDGYRNVATDDVDAALVPPGDPEALAAALGSLLADPTRRERLVRAGYERADGLAMSTLVDRYLEIYEQLLSRS
ncbi:MAG: glycosyltransferase family 4 protein, partial [Ilumatobacteraceae bacterium]